MPLTEIPYQWREIHKEVNEDGRVLWHPGYIVTTCDSCGSGIIHYKEKERTNCGDYKCQK